MRDNRGAEDDENDGVSLEVWRVWRVRLSPPAGPFLGGGDNGGGIGHSTKYFAVSEDAIFARADRRGRLSLRDFRARLMGLFGLMEGGDFFQDAIHAQTGVDRGVDFVMVRAGVHDENFCSGVGFLDHVGEMMAIIFGEGGTEDDEFEGIAAQSFGDALAVKSGRDVMAGLGHLGGLGGECVFVRLAVENLDG